MHFRCFFTKPDILQKINLYHSDATYLIREVIIISDPCVSVKTDYLSPQEKLLSSLRTPPPLLLITRGSHETSLMLRKQVLHRAGRDSRQSMQQRRFPPHPRPNRDPDIKGRWSETMKLQVRCQLPFETKHSPNPGKTRPVPGIRTNKEELREARWRRRRGEGGVEEEVLRAVLTIWHQYKRS